MTFDAPWVPIFRQNVCRSVLGLLAYFCMKLEILGSVGFVSKFLEKGIRPFRLIGPEHAIKIYLAAKKLFGTRDFLGELS
jgi:hypothetical protein